MDEPQPTASKAAAVDLNNKIITFQEIRYDISTRVMDLFDVFAALQNTARKKAMNNLSYFRKHGVYTAVSVATRQPKYHKWNAALLSKQTGKCSMVVVSVEEIGAMLEEFTAMFTVGGKKLESNTVSPK
ncbi:hypothetical protein CYMTET_47160 [Cymbomonas tetramitiformis]|uniref:Uncharacterized protein n=1 Tax=Cymbomonas tetramitiformis TaxID=36881 RepID=A0AAE0EWG1_9CHLO|nr:hypothetical protein CYMTET_47160 [Cymbomonas tetramitiformis]